MSIREEIEVMYIKEGLSAEEIALALVQDESYVEDVISSLNDN